jgi:hypothetical protein
LQLDDMIDLTQVNVVDWSPLLQIIPKNNDNLDALFSVLATSNQSLLKIFKKEDIPEDYHYQNSIRIPPLVGIIEEGWSLTTSDSFPSQQSRFDGGNHGYDPSFQSMHVITLLHCFCFFFFPHLICIETTTKRHFCWDLEMHSFKELLLQSPTWTSTN